MLCRSEFAIDFAAASLDELAGRGLADCSPAWLQAIHLHVYQRSAVKDVRLVNADGSVICSAYSETLEFDKGWVDRRDMLGSRDVGLLLFRVEQFGGDALGVLRNIDRSKARSWCQFQPVRYHAGRAARAQRGAARAEQWGEAGCVHARWRQGPAQSHRF
ncbi:hypothetical protein ACRQ5Q_33215 [Bradyrhizobium sp. PMVTL-01]|uniref:hypothetical protein n=1 Tax=Bradyrhizobium sp. PMVTL-01 TaxID=3434999 RepID=UPI003F710A49